MSNSSTSFMRVCLRNLNLFENGSNSNYRASDKQPVGDVLQTICSVSCQEAKIGHVARKLSKIEEHLSGCISGCFNHGF